MTSVIRRTNREPSLFGSLVLRHRAAAGVTQEQLAARAGLSPDAIAALETGKRRTPRAATVALLAGALGLDEHARAQLEAAAAQASRTSRHACPAATGVEGGGGLSRGAPQHPWWLAAEPTPLVDRVHELETIIRILVDGDTRLLTLVGPAGVGKTRLALAAAARLMKGSGRFPDGVALVDLAPVRDPALVPESVSRALGLLDVSNRPALERLAEALAERRQVLVLDNVEQVLPAAAASLAGLLAACPGLALLVTSRVPLRLRWEHTLRVAPLPVPDLAMPLPALAELRAIPSVELFVGRARARRADFALGERQAPLVAQLVTQMDGLPLALELAAARLDVLPLSALARRLNDRLRLLASQAPDLPERQQSLEAAIGWSYELLSAEEQRLFRHLGVFVGHASVESIAAVLGNEDLDHALEGLVSLAEKSLILRKHDDEDDDRVERGPGEVTFGMLETVREYAEERLAAEGELAAARRAHAYYFLALAERADPALRGPDQRKWFLRLERKHDNMRAALRWLLDGGGRNDSDAAAEREVGMRLAGALGWFWLYRGYNAEGVRWLEAALACAPKAEARVRARALLAAGEVLTVQGEVARARAVLEEALALAEQWQDLPAVAETHTWLGVCAVVGGEVAEGTLRLHEAQCRWEALGDPFGLGEALFGLGVAAEAAGDADAAAAHYMDALQQFGAAGDAQHSGFVHCYLGVIEWNRGALSTAVKQVQAAVRTSVAFQDRFLLSYAAQAAVAFVAAHAAPAAQARLLGATDALAQATGAMVAWELMPGGQEVVGLRERLMRGEDGEELTAAYREGRTLPFAKVAALALMLLEDAAQALPQPEGSPADRPPWRADRSVLTEREAEVLRLVAQGLSSKVIGQQLFLSPSTINQHIKSIFNKLGADTRAQAVAVAARRGLL